MLTYDREQPSQLNKAMSTRTPLSGLHKRLVSGSTWAIIGKAAMAAMGLAINALIARIISPDEVGTYFLVISFVSVAAAMALMGLHQAVVRLVAEAMGDGQPGKARGTVTAALRLVIGGALAIGLLVATGGEFIAKHIVTSDTLQKVMLLTAVWIVFGSILGLLAESFRGFHDYGFATTFSGIVSNAVIVTLLAGIYLSHYKSDLHIVLTISVIAVVISTTLAGYFMRRKFLQLGASTKIHPWKMLGIGLPLMATNIAITILTQTDLWIIGIYGSQEQVATFGTAVRLGQLVYIPLLIGNTVLPPFISEMYSQGRIIELEKVIRAMSTIAAIPACIVLFSFIFFGDTILILVYGEYYRSASVPLAIMSIGQLINVWSGSGMITLMMTGHQRSAMNISIFFGIIIMLGSWTVIRPYGVPGVSVVTGLSTTALAVLTLLWTHRKTGMWTHVGLKNVPAMINKLRAAW